MDRIPFASSTERPKTARKPRHGFDVGEAAEDLSRSYRWTRALPRRVTYRRRGVRPTSLASVDTATLIVVAGTRGVDVRAKEARDELARRCWDKRMVAARRTLPALHRVLVDVPSQWSHPLSLIAAAFADGAAGIVANQEFWCSECPSTRLDGRKIVRSTWNVWVKMMEEAEWIIVVRWQEGGARGCKGRNETCIIVPGPKLLAQLADGAPLAAARRREHEIKIYMRQRGTPPRRVPVQTEITDREPASGEPIDVVWDLLTPPEAPAETPEAEPEPDQGYADLLDRMELATTPLVEIPDERLTPDERARKTDLLAEAARAREARIKAEHERRDRVHPGWREEADAEFFATIGKAPSEPASSVQLSDIRTTTARELTPKRRPWFKARKTRFGGPLGGCAERANTCPNGQAPTSRTSDPPPEPQVLPKTEPVVSPKTAAPSPKTSSPTPEPQVLPKTGAPVLPKTRPPATLAEAIEGFLALLTPPDRSD